MKCRDILDLRIRHLRKRGHAGLAAPDYGSDFIAAFVAQSYSGTNQIRPFGTGRIRAMAEPAGGSEQRLAALHCSRVGNRAAHQKRAASRSAAAGCGCLRT